MRYLTLSCPSDSKLALKLDLINSIENNSYTSEEMRLLLYYTNYNLHAILTVLHISVTSTQDLSYTLGFQREITCFWNKYKGKHVTCISKYSNCCINTGLDELSNISDFIHDNIFKLRVDLNLLSDFEDLFCQLDILEFALEETDKSSIRKTTKAELLYRQESLIAWIHEFYLNNSSSGEYIVRQKYSSRVQEEPWSSYRDMNIQGDITDYLYLSHSCRDIDKPRMSTRRTRHEDLSSFQRPVSTSIKFRNTVC
jgi:hypothetical protein